MRARSISMRLGSRPGFGGVAAELLVVGRDAADARALERLVAERDVGAGVGLGHHRVDDLRIERLDRRGVEHRDVRVAAPGVPSSSSSVMTPILSTLNVPTPTSRMIASAT